jgi:hypothetical protein
MCAHGTIEVYSMQPLSAISPLVPLIILAVVPLIFLRIPILTDILSLPYVVIHWVFSAGGLLKKNENWSVVYDAKTKVPIDPAYITVRNTLGVEVNTMITDLNGRFSLILPRGLYTIEAQKTNYVFPAESLNRAKEDGQYTDLYYGERIEIIDRERSVALAIPMDPVGNDWNQSEKQRKNIFLQLGKDKDFTAAEILYLCIGVLLIGIHYHYTPEAFYLFMAEGYGALGLAMLLWYVFEPTHYSHSIVIEKQTKKPLAFARVNVFTVHGSKIISKITSFEGQFTCLVPKGKYYVTIEERQHDGSYVLRHTSPSFHAYNGAIDRRFSI